MLRYATGLQKDGWSCGYWCIWWLTLLQAVDANCTDFPPPATFSAMPPDFPSRCRSLLEERAAAQALFSPPKEMRRALSGATSPCAKKQKKK